MNTLFHRRNKILSAHDIDRRWSILLGGTLSGVVLLSTAALYFTGQITAWVALVLLLTGVAFILFGISYSSLDARNGPAERLNPETRIPPALTPEPDPTSETLAALADHKAPRTHLLDESEARQLALLSHIAHEIRSPLASIRGYAELLSDPALRQNDEYLTKAYQVIVKQSKQIDCFIEDVVKAALIELGQQENSCRRFRIKKLLEEVVAEAQRNTDRPVILENGVPEAVIFGSMLQIRDLFANLIDNAIKYSPDGEPVRVILRNNHKFIEVTIADQGIGMSRSEQQNIFVPFGRIRNESTRGIPGTGLGLYLACKIVEQHQGEIKVKSSPGKGSTFIVRLPLNTIEG